MAKRTVVVEILAQTAGYMQGMQQVAAKTRETGSEIEKLAQKRQAFQTLAASSLAFGAAVGAVLTASIVKFAQFDQAMSNANAILQESVENQKLLRDAALEAGGVTVYTATESANAIEELGKAGIGTSDILSGALRGSLDLAASGQLGVARAAEITGISLKQFNLDGSQAARVADVLSAGANKAVGSVDDLANGLKFVGPVAAGMNISLEDSVATLALFADRGVIGEQAGTSLRGMLSSLTSPSRQAKAELDRLNVSLYDGQGQFKGLENVAGELQRALAGATDAERDMALGVLFGNQQITAARILVDAGAETWLDYRDAVDDSGIASRIAAQRMDNLAGDVEKLGGAFDTALIKTGANANDVLRFMTQWATDAIDAYANMPAPLQTAAFWVAAVTAAVAIGGGTFFLAVPKVVAFRTAFDELGVSGRRTGRILSTAFKAIGAAAVVGSILMILDKVQDALNGTEASAEDLVNALQLRGAEEAVRKASQGTGRWVSGLRTEFSDLGNMLNQVAGTWDTRWAGFAGEYIGWLDGNIAATDSYRDTLENLGEALVQMPFEDAVASVQEMRNEYDLTDAQMLTFVQSSGPFRDALIAQATAAGIAADDQSLLRIALGEVTPQMDAASRTGSKAADAYLDAADGARSLRDNLAELIEVVMEANGMGQDAVTTNAAYQDALQGVRDSIEEVRKGTEGYSGTLDEGTAAGSSNASMLADLAADAQKAAHAQLELDLQTMGAEDATRLYMERLQSGRDTVLQLGTDLSSNAEAAQLLTDKIFAMPSEKEVDIIVDTAQANSDLGWFVSQWQGKTIRMAVEAGGGYVYNADGALYSNGVRAFAAGGITSGIYPYTPGGIHKFAEAGTEAYISMRPEYRDRNLKIWNQVGDMLGAWRTAGSQAGGSPSPAPMSGTITLRVEGTDGLVRVAQVAASEELRGVAIELQGGAA